ncbi:hypothetical protein B0A50_03353 [Salinomyces thailandicus]|uniref:NAD(P)-binding protein n=1 Tax=Salinomyces thailandicus TaxID=706561 RepID=A0A4U0U359_9PEZI|nr:hypothetical protein B0A50_03353 [Salinomyces thailandica]
MSSTSPPLPPSPSRSTSANPRLSLPATTDPPSDANPSTPKVWLVFGATGHIGRSLVKAALSHGDEVAAVGRTMENSMPQMQGWHENCLGLLCDVRVRETVKSCIESCISHFGRIDIIAKYVDKRITNDLPSKPFPPAYILRRKPPPYHNSCTGYGVIGACEDQDTCDLRSQFETNFMGTLNIIQLSLPYFRSRAHTRSNPDDTAGRYLIFSSTSGALGVPGLGPYCATKYATEGLIESMLYEIDTFGIKATLVEPGHMRLDEPTGLDDKAPSATAPTTTTAAAWVSSSPSSTEPQLQQLQQQSQQSQQPQQHQPVKLRRYGHFFVKKPSPPYDTPTAPAGHAKRVVQWLADRQPTSAVKSAELVWQLGHCRYPPLRLLLGSFAVESIRDRLKSITEEIEDWKHLHFPVAGEGWEGREGEGEGEGAEEEGGEEGEGDVEMKEEGGEEG